MSYTIYGYVEMMQSWVQTYITSCITAYRFPSNYQTHREEENEEKQVLALQKLS